MDALDQRADELKAQILRLTREYSAIKHRGNRTGSENTLPFEPGKTTVPYAGRVFAEEEVEAAVGATLDFWLTLGPEGVSFERELAEFLGVKHSVLVNSGSSANLLAFCALTSHKLPAHKRIGWGDEVITVAAGFPTTVAPIIQNGAVPVFIDNDPTTGNAKIELLEGAYKKGKTKAVMMAHTLGNPFDLGAVLEFCQRYDLWLVEDNCDALGSTYCMPEDRAKELRLEHLLKLANSGAHPYVRREEIDGVWYLEAPTGSWGDVSTQSFYPPHHLTTGEGGAVNIVRRASLRAYTESFRDWGRDCWCASGVDNTCGKRFGWQLGELPAGYDHKYIYSHFGYNLKPLDIQAAIGRQQIKRLPSFIEARKNNWEYLRRGLADLEEFFVFSLPTHATGWRRESPPSAGRASFTWDSSESKTDCSWFGFMLGVRPTAPFSRTELARRLDEAKIATRMLFGGNLICQPAFVQLRRVRPDAFRVAGSVSGADQIMNTSLFLGTYPGLTRAMLDYEIETILAFVSNRARR